MTNQVSLTVAILVSLLAQVNISSIAHWGCIVAVNWYVSHTLENLILLVFKTTQVVCFGGMPK